MPLCNNLTDLTQRDNVGWCLYSIVLTCIIFNILILLIRCLSIFCEYIKARAELVKALALVKPEKEEISVSNPFPPEKKEEPEPARREPTFVRPQARDFHTFGRGEVQNSV